MLYTANIQLLDLNETYLSNTLLCIEIRVVTSIIATCICTKIEKLCIYLCIYMFMGHNNKGLDAEWNIYLYLAKSAWDANDVLKK